MDTKSRGDSATSRLNQLEEALKTSFSNIKQDMSNLKDSILVVQNQVVQARNDADNSQKYFVSIDKLNAMKVKLADMNEDLKKSYAIQESIKKIEAKISAKDDAPSTLVDKKTFEAEKRKNSETISELKNSIELIERAKKSAVTEMRFKQLTAEVSAQINEMRNTISLFDEKGGKIISTVSDNLREDVDRKLDDSDKKLAKTSESVKEELSMTSSRLKEEVREIIKLDRKETNRKLLKLLEGINTVRDENQKYVSKNQISDLLRSINHEFDSVKEQMLEVDMVKKDIKTMRRDKLNKASYDQQAAEMKMYIDDLKNNMMDLNERIDETNQMIKRVESKKMAVKFIPKKFQDNGSGSSALLIIANIMIALSFILLGVSFGMYYLVYMIDYLNYVIIGAVVMFVLGIILRIISVLRE
jgi:hypothetical protein